ncbi:MAG: contractile injection system protein, VgrG/Pvc8 family [Myxococcota bacterium]|nr:contractile injection system protein, VgrG/Pvc8 family [Myxococcota bacterium]
MSSQPRSTAVGFEVTIGGQTFTQASEEGGVQMLVVEDHVDMTDMLTLRMGGTQGQPDWNWKIGDEVECKLGSGGTIFKGQITAMEPGYQVEGTSTVTLRAMDQMHKLGRGRKTRTFEDMKDSDVVSQVAGEAGIPTGNIEATSEIHPYILQRNESDVAFLKRLAARNNYLLTMEDGSIAFKRAQFGGGGYKLKMGDNLRSMRMSFNSMDQVQKVVVRGWDPHTKQAIVGEATTADVERIGGGEVGADTAGQFGESTAYITDVPVFSQAAANEIAKVEMNRLARQFGRGSATVQGNEQIRAGTTVEVEGLQKGNNGTFFILSSRHVISNRSGYTTEFSFCTNTMGT